MTDTEHWLTRYGETHSEIASPLVYWAAVPMVVVGAVGLLWWLPVPEELSSISPVINWGTLFLMAAAVYYFIISVPLAIGMLPFLVGVAYVQVWLETSQYSPLSASMGFLAAGVLGLLLGQRRERPIIRVLQDLQMMMIGPAWLLSVLYRRMGIPI
jgi:uncharacterized membrane protein YGL010W